MRDAFAGDTASAVQEAKSAITMDRAKSVESDAALALALCGDAAQANALITKLDKISPHGTIVQFEILPMVRAALLLHSDPGKAVETLGASERYELSQYAHLYPPYLRGQAYLAAKQGKAAAVEFQKILDHPGVTQTSVVGAFGTRAGPGFGGRYGQSQIGV